MARISSKLTPGETDISLCDQSEFRGQQREVGIAHGGADTVITMEDVAALSKELEEAGVTYEIEVYSGAPHAFTVKGSNSYQERADMKSWEAFNEFLGTTLGS